MDRKTERRSYILGWLMVVVAAMAYCWACHQELNDKAALRSLYTPKMQKEIVGRWHEDRGRIVVDKSGEPQLAEWLKK